MRRLNSFMQAFNGIGCPRAFPLARWQPDKGEETLAGFLHAVGHRTALQPSFAQERSASRIFWPSSRTPMTTSSEIEVPCDRA